MLSLALWKLAEERGAIQQQAARARWLGSGKRAQRGERRRRRRRRVQERQSGQKWKRQRRRVVKGSSSDDEEDDEERANTGGMPWTVCSELCD